MLVEQKLNTLLELINTSSNDELIWINGYLNGVLSKQKPEVKVAPKNATQKITIVYGTETGNSKRLATDFAAKAKKLGHHAKIQGLDQYRLTDLSKEEYLLAIMSTHGDGEPPLAAQKFYDFVHANELKLSKLKGTAGEPIVYFESYFHPRIGLNNKDDFGMPLYTMLEEKYGIMVKRSSENIKAMLAGKIAKKLKVLESDPILFRERYVYDAGDRPTEYNLGYYRSDKFTYSIDIKKT